MQSHRRADAGASYMDRARLHSIPDGDCLVWQGSTANGVPRVGRSAADRATSMAPINLRVAVLAEVRPPRPPDAYTAHATCGTDLCVNPDHLAWETRDEFYGRLSTAPASRPALKWSDERIREAWDWHQGGVSVSECAVRLGISRSRLYKRWSRLDLPDTVDA